MVSLERWQIQRMLGSLDALQQKQQRVTGMTFSTVDDLELSRVLQAPAQPQVPHSDQQVKQLMVDAELDKIVAALVGSEKVCKYT